MNLVKVANTGINYIFWVLEILESVLITYFLCTQWCKKVNKIYHNRKCRHWTFFTSMLFENEACFYVISVIKTTTRSCALFVFQLHTLRFYMLKVKLWLQCTGKWKHNYYHSESHFIFIFNTRRRSYRR